MGKTIAIANEKGGVGKTTTAINLSAALAEKGNTVLVLDIDPQGNTTSGLGINKKKLKITVYDLFLGNVKIDDVMVKSTIAGITVIPSDVDLAAAEIELIGVNEREFILKKAVDPIRDKFDYIIIDCPPSLNTLTINAMTTANTILIPVQCEFYALEGLSQLFRTIDLVQKRLNPELEIEGIVFTMYDSRTNLSVQVVDNVKKNLKQHIYKTMIPRNVRLAEAPSHGLPITVYDSKSAGAESYRQLAVEVMEQNKRKWY